MTGARLRCPVQYDVCMEEIVIPVRNGQHYGASDVAVVDERYAIGDSSTRVRQRRRPVNLDRWGMGARAGDFGPVVGLR